MEKSYAVKHLKRTFDLVARKRSKIEKDKAIVKQMDGNCIEISTFAKGILSEKALCRWFLIAPQKGYGEQHILIPVV